MALGGNESGDGRVGLIQNGLRAAVNGDHLIDTALLHGEVQGDVLRQRDIDVVLLLRGEAVGLGGNGVFTRWNGESVIDAGGVCLSFEGDDICVHVTDCDVRIGNHCTGWVGDSAFETGIDGLRHGWGWLQQGGCHGHE